MEYQYIEHLESFVEKIDRYLHEDANQVLVDFTASKYSIWNSEEFLKANNNLLSALSCKANVYAIFTANTNSENYCLRYIGKTTKKLARQRIRNHLFKKSKKTGSKLNKVTDHIQSGGKIKISWVGIEPESLRNYVEEELIRNHKGATWNRENAKKHRQ